MSRRTLLFLTLLVLLVTLSGLSQTGGSDSPYLMRIERQTRDENVCMLVLKDSRYHLERVASGQSRVYEGTLSPTALGELAPLLNSEKIVALKQSQVDTAPGDDVDQMMLTIPRAGGWQSLTFPSNKSRKPFKTELDALLKWLDRNKQVSNPIAGAAPNRCVPPKENVAARGLAAPSASNPYIMRMVVDHYEATGTGSALSMDKGTAGESVGGVTSAQAMDVSKFKITRTCALVYGNGRYRFEKNVREAGKVTKSEVYRESLNQAQLDELRQLLDNPKLVALPNNVAPTLLGREGDLITLAIARGTNLQSVGFASSGPRPASASLQDASMAALSANVGLTNPVRKWVKQNLEDNKAAVANGVQPTTCIPSAEPE